MAEFSTNRLTDDSAISTVDNALGASEGAHADIFGIPKDQPIVGSIFGGVDTSGRITGDGLTPAGVPTIYNTSSTEATAAAIDFQSQDGGNDIGFRIVPIFGELRIYEREEADENLGSLVQNLALTRRIANNDDCDLVDDPDDGLLDYAGQILAVDSDPPYNIIAVNPSAGGGASEFTGLDDTPISYLGATDGMNVVCADGATPGTVDHLEFRAGGGAVSNFIDLGDTFASYAAKKQSTIAVAEDETGLVASYQYYARGGTSASIQALSYQALSMMVDWGTSVHEFPPGVNMIQGDTIYLPQELDRDCIYQLNYSILFTAKTLGRSTIGIQLVSYGVCIAYHENVSQGQPSYELGEEPPVGMNGSFLVRVPYGSDGAEETKIQVRVGRAGRIAAATPTTWKYVIGSSPNDELKFQVTAIEICRVN